MDEYYFHDSHLILVPIEHLSPVGISPLTLVRYADETQYLQFSASRTRAHTSSAAHGSMAIFSNPAC